jgi:hypothetical protein
MPNLRFAAAAAVTLLAVVGAWRWLAGPDQVALRGDARTEFSLEPPRVLSDGAIELRWAAIPDADAYQVILLRDDLSEVARLDATADLSVTVEPSLLPAGSTRWQVAAFREGALEAESLPQYLPR